MKFPEIMMSKIPVSLWEFLESRGFTCIAATYDEANFGDIVLDCTDSDLIIRVVILFRNRKYHNKRIV